MAGQEAVYLRALLRGFNFRQVGATEIWEDNASCIIMSENPANRERTRHVDTRVHDSRELVRNVHVKLLKCAEPQNVADALTVSLPRKPLPNLGNTCPQHITFRIAQKAGIAFRLNKYDCEFYSEAN